jgi:AraC-like DNA-binding protein
MADSQRGNDYLFERYKVAEVRDPRSLATAFFADLPAQYEAYVPMFRYAPHNLRAARAEADRYRVTLSYTGIGRLRVAHLTDSHGTEIRIGQPGIAATCLTLVTQGSMELVSPEHRGELIADAANGLIYRGRPGTRVLTSDNDARLNLWIPDELLRPALERLIEAPVYDEIAFDPQIPWSAGSAASVRRIFHHLTDELRANSLLSNALVGRAFEEWVIYSLLLGLPHNHTQRLQGQRTAAAPRNVRRAEEFIRANANAPLTIAEIANAAGCSIRALQMAFRCFRETTPMRALQRARLEQARAELLRADNRRSLARIAEEHGFSSPSRFAQAFHRVYGVYPSQATGTRRSRQSMPVDRSVINTRTRQPS